MRSYGITDKMRRVTDSGNIRGECAVVDRSETSD